MVSDVNLIASAVLAAGSDYSTSCVEIDDVRWMVVNVAAIEPAAPSPVVRDDILPRPLRRLFVEWLVPFVRLFFPPRPPRPYAGSTSSAVRHRHDFDFVWERDAW